MQTVNVSMNHSFSIVSCVWTFAWCICRVCTSRHLYFITAFHSKGNGIQLCNSGSNLFLLRGTRINHPLCTTEWTSHFHSRINATCCGRIEISHFFTVPTISFEPSKSCASDTSRWSLPLSPLTACSALDQLAATFLLWKREELFIPRCRSSLHPRTKLHVTRESIFRSIFLIEFLAISFLISKFPYENSMEDEDGEKGEKCRWLDSFDFCMHLITTDGYLGDIDHR